MMKFLATLIFSLFFGTFALANNGTLILVVDNSSSIEEPELVLQLDTYAKLTEEIPTLQLVNVEAIIFGDDHFHISSGSNLDASKAFASFPILPATERGSTCLTKTLMYIDSIVLTLPQPVTIDISGDGEANCPHKFKLPEVLASLEKKNVRINTLFIKPTSIAGTSEPDKMIDFYKSLVINGGFFTKADTFYEFEDALYRKLVVEVSMMME